jgi:hypothetical protein
VTMSRLSDCDSCVAQIHCVHAHEKYSKIPPGVQRTVVPSAETAWKLSGNSTEIPPKHRDHIADVGTASARRLPGHTVLSRWALRARRFFGPAHAQRAVETQAAGQRRHLHGRRLVAGDGRPLPDELVGPSERQRRYLTDVRVAARTSGIEAVGAARPPGQRRHPHDLPNRQARLECLHGARLGRVAVRPQAGGSNGSRTGSSGSAGSRRTGAGTRAVISPSTAPRPPTPGLIRVGSAHQ